MDGEEDGPGASNGASHPIPSQNRCIRSFKHVLDFGGRAGVGLRHLTLGGLGISPRVSKNWKKHSHGYNSLSFHSLFFQKMEGLHIYREEGNGRGHLGIPKVPYIKTSLENSKDFIENEGTS